MLLRNSHNPLNNQTEILYLISKAFCGESTVSRPCVGFYKDLLTHTHNPSFLYPPQFQSVKGLQHQSPLQSKCPTSFPPQPLPRIPVRNLLFFSQAIPTGSPISATRPVPEPLMPIFEHFFHTWRLWRTENAVGVLILLLFLDQTSQFGRLNPIRLHGAFRWVRGVVGIRIGGDVVEVNVFTIYELRRCLRWCCKVFWQWRLMHRWWRVRSLRERRACSPVLGHIVDLLARAKSLLLRAVLLVRLIDSRRFKQG